MKSEPRKRCGSDEGATHPAVAYDVGAASAPPSSILTVDVRY